MAAPRHRRSHEALPAPVVLLNFNRPDLTRQVIEATLGSGPRLVFACADGPRPGNDGDAERCEEVRALLTSAAWPGDLRTRFSDVNLGCGRAVSSAIDWSFAQVERAIVLEDDCVPSPDFFPFADEMLDRYADDERVLHVSGTNGCPPRQLFGGASYGFSRFANIWGWATWRRAWAGYDYEMSDYRQFRASRGVRDIPITRAWQRIVLQEWDAAHRGEGTWDHQWQYAVMKRRGLAVVPAENLVTNLGFRHDGTQTAGDWNPFAALPLGRLEGPYVEPPDVEITSAYDEYVERGFRRYFGLRIRAARLIVRSPAVRRRLSGLANAVWRSAPRSPSSSL